MAALGGQGTSRSVAPPLLTSNALVDLDGLVQDLVEVCRSPAAIDQPEVGGATLALCAATSLFARLAETRAKVSHAHSGLQEALSYAHDALARARVATERARHSRQQARTILARVNARRTAGEGAASLLRAWTTPRDARVTCPACRAALTVRY